MKGILKTSRTEKTPKTVKFKLEKKSRNRRGNKKRKDRSIRILYANANGVKGKIKSLQSAVDEHKSQIVAITETKQPPPRLKGYTFDRKNKQGGGVQRQTVKMITIRNSGE